MITEKKYTIQSGLGKIGALALGLGAVLFACFAVDAVLRLNAGAGILQWVRALVYLSLVIGDALALMRLCFWRVTVIGTRIEYRNMWGKITKLSFVDLKGVVLKRHLGEDAAFVQGEDGQLFAVGAGCTNYYEFLNDCAEFRVKLHGRPKGVRAVRTIRK